MSFLPAKPFIPTVSTVPILDASSGNPSSYKDQKSIASIGATIQAMSDQANADALYDAPAPKEGFVSNCDTNSNDLVLVSLLAVSGLALMIYSAVPQ